MPIDGYPTTEELEKVVSWPHTDPWGLVDYLKNIWWYPERQIRTGPAWVELSTAGWSGNEDIIEALKKNGFWFLYWEKSERGGHYRFEGLPKREVMRKKEGGTI